MPYIKDSERRKFEGAAELGKKANSAGELNYLIFRISIGYMLNKGISYQTFNDIAGVLSNVDKELYGRLVQYYEGAKRIENGDVIYPEEMRELSFG